MSKQQNKSLKLAILKWVTIWSIQGLTWAVHDCYLCIKYWLLLTYLCIMIVIYLIWTLITWLSEISLTVLIALFWIYIYIYIYVHTNKKENKQKNIYMKTKYKISLQWSTTFFFRKFWPSYILDLPETFVQSISWGICARVLCFNVKRNHCTLTLSSGTNLPLYLVHKIFGEIQNVASPELSGEKFSVSLEKDLIFCFRIYFSLVLLVISQFQIYT